MLADANLAAVGRVLGDSHRARFVLALLGGQELPAGELAARTGASSSLASSHLAKLRESGLISVRRQGRQRYYRLASPDVAQAIETLLAIAPRHSVTGLTNVTRGRALQRARTCYDHLAGKLGVALADAFEQQRLIATSDSGWTLTSQGGQRLGALGVDTSTLHRGRRPLLRPCLDWTERRPHMAGLLGQALASRLLDLDWVRRTSASRALLITDLGERQLLTEFAIKLLKLRSPRASPNLVPAFLARQRSVSSPSLGFAAPVRILWFLTSESVLTLRYWRTAGDGNENRRCELRGVLRGDGWASAGQPCPGEPATSNQAAVLLGRP